MRERRTKYSNVVENVRAEGCEEEWPDYSSVKGRHRTTGGEGATSHHKPMTLTYQEPLSVKMILGAAGSQTVQEWCHCTTDCLHLSLLLWTSLLFSNIQFLPTGRICDTSNFIVRLEFCAAAGQIVETYLSVQQVKGEDLLKSLFSHANSCRYEYEYICYVSNYRD